MKDSKRTGSNGDSRSLSHLPGTISWGRIMYYVAITVENLGPKRKG